jgi:hypothetical protein
MPCFFATDIIASRIVGSTVGSRVAKISSVTSVAPRGAVHEYRVIVEYSWPFGASWTSTTTVGRVASPPNLPFPMGGSAFLSYTPVMFSFVGE